MTALFSGLFVVPAARLDVSLIAATGDPAAGLGLLSSLSRTPA